MSSRSGKEKWVFTFSFIMVTILKVYRIVLKHKILGICLKQALLGATEQQHIATLK